MNWNDFFKAVKNRQYQNIYLFAGPEELTKREALEALRKALLPAGLEQLNEAILENCSAQSIIDSADTLPVMCEKRLVVVRDWAAFTSGKMKNIDAEVDRMIEWMKNPPDSCILVFYMTVEIDERKKMFKKVKEANGYVEFTHLSGPVLLKWCNQQLKPMQKKIGSDALNELTLMAGQDLTRLSGELKKLTAYIEDAPEISVADVRAIVTPTPDYVSYMILDHLLAGDLFKATQVLNAQMKDGMKIIYLISMFEKQLRLDAHIKYAMEKKNNMDSVFKALDLNPYRGKHIMRQIENIPAEALQTRYQSCVETHYDITSGRVNDRAALNDLMLKIVMPKAGTKAAAFASKR